MSGLVGHSSYLRDEMKLYTEEHRINMTETDINMQLVCKNTYFATLTEKNSIIKAVKYSTLWSTEGHTAPK